MDNQNAQMKQIPGAIYYAGMEWRGVILNGPDAAALNQFDIDIAKARAPEARSWLKQNKAAYMALILGIEIVPVG